MMTSPQPLSKTLARGILLLLALLMIYGVAVSLRPAPPPIAAVTAHAPPTSKFDLVLYRAVAQRVAHGENYYDVVINEQRTRGIEMRPFVAVRPPLIAYMTAYLGETGMIWALHSVAFLTFFALMMRLELLVSDMRVRLGALTLGALGIFLLTTSGLALFHDIWAGLLIMLSLLIHRPKTWVPSLIIGLIAVLMRELTLPYLLVMAAMAFKERHQREGLAWLGALGFVGAMIALHAHEVNIRLTAADLPSYGWVEAQGWPFILTMVHMDSIFRIAPLAVNACLVSLAFLGWLGGCTGFSNRVALWLGGMAFTFMIVGRDQNFYWGLHLAYLLPMGLAFAPQALVSLSRSAFRP